ncbi:MAG: B12-binding domain-containing radical SAM protein [Deltaproteobacteria bacterium]|jgi:radical SAM superfamily enzyme YgiQ (UPF0313 family)|nr:B12-binding domain-containing radical SAM protein [Deltaproteobacteria bacterium]
MKILYINLPYKFEISRTSRWPEKTKSGTLYYPFWLAYSAGYSQLKGHEVQLIDCIASGNSRNSLFERVSEFSPDYIVTEITTSTCVYDFETIAEIKRQFPNPKIIVAGTHATALPELVLKSCPSIDIVARSEYELMVVELASGQPLTDILGISYLKDGVFQSNSDRQYCDNLDEFPFVSKVYKQFLNFNDYFYSFAQKPMIQIFSARGCPHHCNFCSYPETMGGRAFRKRSVSNLVDELEYISRELPEIREIFIEDDTFTVDQKRVAEICDEIIRRNLKILWSCNTRVDLSLPLMRKMKEAGCRLLVVGFESGNQEVLDQTRKGIKLTESLAFAENSKLAGLKVFGCFMIGLTGDTLETIEETFRFAKRCCPDMCFFQQAVPFPGTRFYQWVKEKGYLITEDYGQWLNDDGYLNCLVQYPWGGPKDVERLRDKLMSRYYFSFTYIIKTFLSNLSWQEFKRVTKGAWAYFSFRAKKILKK